MAVKLRLRRMGKKKQPMYKVVAVDTRVPRDGKFLEAVGSYNPRAASDQVQINEDRALYWLGVGAQPTQTVRSLLRKTGVTLKRELLKRNLPAELIDAEMQKWKDSKKEVSKPEVKTKPKSKESTAEGMGASSDGKTAAEVTE